MGLALLTTATVLLTGCATTDQDPRSASATTGPCQVGARAPATKTPAAATVDFGQARAGPGAPSCSTLLPSDLVDFPGARRRAAGRRREPSAHAIGSLATVRVAGGTVCSATNGVAQIDDVVPTTRDGPPPTRASPSPCSPTQPLPSGTPVEQATTPQETATVVRCDASDSARVFCHGGVLAGTAWVDVDVVRLPDVHGGHPRGDAADLPRAARRGAHRRRSLPCRHRHRRRRQRVGVRTVQVGPPQRRDVGRAPRLGVRHRHRARHR